MDFSNMPAPTPPFMTDSEEMLPQFPPTHPVPAMQGAFEESMYEQSILMYPSGVGGDFKPQFHRLEKLVSQVAFGMHLLHKQLAISETEVVRIMQGHVNEMDDFLSQTTSLFESIKGDIVARTKHLRLPLDSGTKIARTFDDMLMDGDYRRQVLEGNEKVEYIIKTTVKQLYKTLRSIGAGLKAVDMLGRYLSKLKQGWSSKNLLRVFHAMVQNVEQWYRCLVGLQAKGISLGETLQTLKIVVRRIEKRAARASQKASHQEAYRHSRQPQSQKPDPKARLRLDTSATALKPLPISPAVTPIIFTLHDTTPPPTPLRPQSQRSYTRSRPLHSPVSPLTRKSTVTTARRARRAGSPVSPLTTRSFSYRKARPLSHPAASVPRSRRSSIRRPPTGSKYSVRHTTYLPSPKVVDTDPVLEKIRELQKKDRRKRLSKRRVQAPPIKPSAPPTKREKEEIGVGVWANTPTPKRKRCSLGRAILGDVKGKNRDCVIM